MRALVVAAHPDDEVLGAGATVASLAAKGWDVSILILAEGVSLRHPGMTLEAARENCRRASAELGVTNVAFGGFAADGVHLADGQQKAVVAAVEQALKRSSPELMLTHHPGDVHADHRIVSQSVSYATSFLGRGSVRSVLHFEIPSSTEQQTGLVAPFIPNVFFDVSGYIKAKCSALAVYDYEIRDERHPRSVTGVQILARHRGLQAGVVEAEAFALGRHLVTAEGGAW